MLTKIGRSPVWSGDYPDWQSALTDSAGYDQESIADRVLAATLAVKNGEGAFEQDAVVYPEMEYDWPFASALMIIAAGSGGRLNLVDFGGGLGGTYSHYRAFFDELSSVTWSVVEQDTYVALGREHLEDDTLRFFDDLDACLAVQAPNAIVLGSVLAYLESPEDLLAKIAASDLEYVLIDRTAFIEAAQHRLTVQVVPERIYAASYPCWMLSRSRILNLLGETFDLVLSYECDDLANIESTFEGHLFRRRVAP